MAPQPDHKRKIVDLVTLLDLLPALRARGATIVQCHGCFDIVHPGHVRYLEFASRQGDVLIVTITGDSDITKGDQRPYIPQELRAENLAALEFVDYVYIDPTPTAESVIEAVRPDVYVKGREYATSHDPRFLAERQVVESYGGRVIFSSGDVVFSSSAIIAHLPRQEELEAARLKVVCQRHDITRAGLADLVERFPRLRVAVIGDVIVDRYVFCDAVDVAGDSPTMSLARLNEQTFVGGAALVARQAAALGADAVLLDAAAGDSRGAEVARLLEAEGVEFRTIADRTRSIERTTYLVEHHKLLRVESGDVTPLDSRAERLAADALATLARNCDAVIFCDYGYGAITPSLLDRVLPRLRPVVPVLTGDAGGQRGRWLDFREMDLLCPSERALRRALHSFDEGLSSVAWRLAHHTRARHLICTLGQRGLVVFDRRTQDHDSPAWADRLQSEHFPSLAHRSVDRSGSGEALLTAATLALAAGAPLLTAAYLGQALSALTMTHLGHDPVSANDLARNLTHRPELTTSPAPRPPHLALGAASR